MVFNECNKELQPVLEACAFADPDELVPAPWLSGQFLTGEGRAGAIVAIDGSLLGITKSENGRYRFYFNESNTGNWFFELWTTARSASVLSLLTCFGFLGFLLRGPIVPDSILLLSGSLLIAAFCRRVTSLPVHWSLVSTSGQPSFGPGIVPAMLGVSAGAGYVAAGVLLLAGFEIAGPQLAFVETWKWGVVAGAAMASAGLLCAVVVLVSRQVWGRLLYLQSLRTCGQRLTDCTFYTVNALQAASKAGLDRKFGSVRGWHSAVFAGLLGLGMILVAWPIMSLLP